MGDVEENILEQWVYVGYPSTRLTTKFSPGDTFHIVKGWCLDTGKGRPKCDLGLSKLCVSNWVETFVAASLRKVSLWILTENFDVCFHNRAAAEQMALVESTVQDKRLSLWPEHQQHFSLKNLKWKMLLKKINACTCLVAFVIYTPHTVLWFLNFHENQ